MANPITFPSTTANFALPLLFTGQAQKEFLLNQSTVTIDALLQRCVDASQNSPPDHAAQGQCYRVTPTAEAEWSGQEGKLAIRVADAWLFVAPLAGMMVFDRSAKQHLIFRSAWESAPDPAPLQGGSVVDLEARALLGEVVGALRTLGIFADQD